MGGLPDKGLDISSVEECEFLCLLIYGLEEGVVVPVGQMQVHVGPARCGGFWG